MRAEASKPNSADGSSNVQELREEAKELERMCTAERERERVREKERELRSTAREVREARKLAELKGVMKQLVGKPQGGSAKEEPEIVETTEAAPKQVLTIEDKFDRVTAEKTSRATKRIEKIAGVALGSPIYVQQTRERSCTPGKEFKRRMEIKHIVSLWSWSIGIR